jgi:hypothetical protein
MPDTITITDPGWDWVFTAWIVALPAAGLLVVITLLALSFILPGRSRRKALRGGASAIGFITLILGAFAFLLIAMIGSDIYEDRIYALQTEALEDAGFEKVTLTYDRFTASMEGDYFSGVLVETDTLTYQIVEIK